VGGQKHVSITQGREIDRRVVVSRSDFCKFTTQEEHDRPQTNLDQVCRQRKEDYERHNSRVSPKASSRSAKAVQSPNRPSQQQGLDQNRCKNGRNAYPKAGSRFAFGAFPLPLHHERGTHLVPP